MRWPGDRGAQPKDLQLKREGELTAGRLREHPAARLREAVERNESLMDENVRLRGERDDLSSENQDLRQRVNDQQGIIMELRMRLSEQ